MSTKLAPGDRCYFLQNNRKLRCVVTDTLNMKVKGEELLVPVVRPRNTSKPATARLDHNGRPPKPLKIRWLERTRLRKLPDV